MGHLRLGIIWGGIFSIASIAVLTSAPLNGSAGCDAASSRCYLGQGGNPPSSRAPSAKRRLWVKADRLRKVHTTAGLLSSVNTRARPSSYSQWIGVAHLLQSRGNSLAREGAQHKSGASPPSCVPLLRLRPQKPNNGRRCSACRPRPVRRRRVHRIHIPLDNYPRQVNCLKSYDFLVDG